MRQTNNIVLLYVFKIPNVGHDNITNIITNLTNLYTYCVYNQLYKVRDGKERRSGRISSLRIVNESAAPAPLNQYERGSADPVIYER